MSLALTLLMANVTALILLDLSAAADTIDNNILIRHLTQHYAGCLHTWLIRRQALKIETVSQICCPSHVTWCPPGFCFGSHCFSLSVQRHYLVSYLSKVNLNHHLYTDDTQISISLATADTCRSLNQLRDCLQDASLWMKNSKLKLNADTTEFLIIDTQCSIKNLMAFPKYIWTQSITPAPQC